MNRNIKSLLEHCSKIERKIASSNYLRIKTAQSWGKDFKFPLEQSYMERALDILDGEDPISDIKDLGDNPSEDDAKLAFAINFIVETGLKSKDLDIVSAIMKIKPALEVHRGLIRSLMDKMQTSTAIPEKTEAPQKKKEWVWKPLDWLATANIIVQFAERNKSSIRQLPSQDGRAKIDPLSTTREWLNNLFSANISSPDADFCHMLQILLLSVPRVTDLRGLDGKPVWQSFAELTGRKVPGIFVNPMLEPSLKHFKYNQALISKIKAAWGTV